MKKMRSKIRRYIYISTDSVYEVCKEPSHEGPTLEEDAVRPEDPRERDAYAQRDLYGSNKLECKEHKIQWYRLRLNWSKFGTRIGFKFCSHLFRICPSFKS